MKFFSVAIFALAIFGARAAPSADDDVDVAKDVEEAIKKILDALDEPLFDVKEKNFTLDLTLESVSGILNEIKLSGIKGLKLETNDYDKETSRLDYSYNFEDISALLDVELLLQGLLNFDHHPIVSVVLSNLKLSGYAVVDVESTPNKVTDFSLLVTLDEAEVEASGILNNDELSSEISEALTKELPTVVNSISEVLAPVINPVVKALINLILELVD